MTFLELCQRVASRAGIATNAPTTVEGQTGILGKLVTWVVEADTYIQTMYHDWKFLFKEGSQPVTTGSAEVLKPTDYAHADITTFVLDDGTDKVELQYMEYRDFKQLIKLSTTEGTPTCITLKPNGNFQLYPTPEIDYTLTFDYYRTPVELSANSDESLIPERFHRLIVLQAVIYYAEDQEADNLTNYVVPQYDELMSRLRSDQLPGSDMHWTAQNEVLQVIPE